MVDKRVHDDALEIIHRLGPMGSSDEDWNAVLMAYAYTFNYLSDQHSLFAVNVAENPKRSLEHVFAGFTRRTHGFDKVRRGAAARPRPARPLLTPPSPLPASPRPARTPPRRSRSAPRWPPSSPPRAARSSRTRVAPLCSAGCPTRCPRAAAP